MSLEDYRYRVSALNKSSAPYEKTSVETKIPSIITKNKKYLICIIGVLLLLIIIKPKFIQGEGSNKNGEKSNKNGEESNKNDSKINVSSLLKYWIIISLILCIAIYVYCNVICKKKNTSTSSSCKRCGS